MPELEIRSRDRRRSIKRPWESYLASYNLTVHEVKQDPRLMRVLKKKKQVDDQIADLIASGARLDRIMRTATLLGFSRDEVVGDTRVASLVKSLIDARVYYATLCPKKETKSPEGVSSNG